MKTREEIESYIKVLDKGINKEIEKQKTLDSWSQKTLSEDLEARLEAIKTGLKWVLSDS